ncbi:MAG: hypothetical protein ACYDH9_01450 [Limisphaerales bacterium]
MEPDWAAENIQAIRTLMERAAIYRRALAPIMFLTGSVGLLAAVLGGFLPIASARGFLGYWLGVSLLPLAGSFWLVRRQALKDAEPFWSPPARRVGQALLPPLTSGLIISVVLLIHLGRSAPEMANVIAMVWVPSGWVILYGCAIHAAGFFMPRGMKLFGWVFIAGGCGLFALGIPDVPRPLFAHGVMGFFFGVLHLAYGLYLTFTTKEKNAA